MGIAGSMITTIFDRSSLYQLIHSKNDEDYMYYAKEGEGYQLANTNNDPWAWSKRVQNMATDGTYDTDMRKAEYSDQIMPPNSLELTA